MTEVQIPAKAVSTGTDLREPTQALLRAVSLLGSDTDMDKAGNPLAALTGPPQSVALIEAGATAASKWWATGLGATVAATWAAVVKWWGTQEPDLKRAVVFSAAVVSAALVLAIGYLIASDVRGRAAAAVATINARASIAEAMVAASQKVYDPTSAAGGDVQIAGLPTAIKVRYVAKQGADEHGWLAVAVERAGSGTLQYVLVKGREQVRATADTIDFEVP